MSSSALLAISSGSSYTLFLLPDAMVVRPSVLPHRLPAMGPGGRPGPCEYANAPRVPKNTRGVACGRWTSGLNGSPNRLRPYGAGSLLFAGLFGRSGQEVLLARQDRIEDNGHDEGDGDAVRGEDLLEQSREVHEDVADLREAAPPS